MSRTTVHGVDGTDRGVGATDHAMDSRYRYKETGIPTREPQFILYDLPT